MNLGKVSLLVFSTLFLASGNSVANEAANRWLNRKAEGWFWYEKFAEPIEEVEEEKPLPPPAAPAPAEVKPPPNVTPPKAPFSSAWLRENLKAYMDAAIDNPTVENVRTFLYLQRLSLDKAEDFASASEMAVQGDPYLDELTRRPSSTFATQKLDYVAGQERTKLLEKVAQSAGIFFFYDDSEMSEVQVPIIKALERYGFAIVAVSINGKPTKNNEFPDYKTDSGHSQLLDIKTYPSTFLVSADGKFEPMGQGVMALPEMVQRLLIAASRNNWITAEEYNKTKPLANTETSLTPHLQSTDVQELIKSQGSSETGFIDPSILHQYIRSKIKGQ